jgi:hypothetical protein
MIRIVVRLSFVTTLVLAGCVATGSQADQSGQGGAGAQSSQNASGVLSRQQAIDQHWNEIRGNLNGPISVTACSDEGGNCESVSADIVNGAITTLHFSNGGALGFSAYVDGTGAAVGKDERGHGWHVTVPMSSPLVGAAVNAWAKNAGYALQ